MDYHQQQDGNPDTLQIAMAVDTTPGTVVMLMRLATAIKKRSTEERLGVKLRQLMLLSYLRYGAPALQQQLCEALWLDANNCVLLLNELEDMGYIERRRDAADRRRHVVELTAAGRVALEQAERAQESIGDELLTGLSEEERAALDSLLSRALEPVPRSG
jgi:DNA-binding MarR family transcriptional regulator